MSTYADQLKDIKGIDWSKEITPTTSFAIEAKSAFDPQSGQPYCPRCQTLLDVKAVTSDLKPLWWCKVCQIWWRIDFT